MPYILIYWLSASTPGIYLVGPYLIRTTPFFDLIPRILQPRSFNTPVLRTCVPPHGQDHPATVTIRTWWSLLPSPPLYSDISKFSCRRLHKFWASSLDKFCILVGMFWSIRSFVLFHIIWNHHSFRSECEIDE